MKEYKVKATRLFHDGLENKERKAGDVFDCTEERYKVLKEHNAVELVHKGEPVAIEPIPNANPEEVEVVELKETPKKKTTRTKKNK